jgi:hypothetical protein
MIQVFNLAAKLSSHPVKQPSGPSLIRRAGAGRENHKDTAIRSSAKKLNSRISVGGDG